MMFARTFMPVTAFAAIAAAATPTTDFERVWQPYTTQLARQCPAKHLEWLAPAELRDALDDYKTHLSVTARQDMDRAEVRHCANVMAGASCSNVGDIEVAETRRALPQLAESTCDRFAMCREQSDCDPASAEQLNRAIHEKGAGPVAASLTEAEWDVALDEAAGGRVDWLQAISRLRATGNVSRAEDVDKALSDALLTSPAEVFRLIRAHPRLPRTTWLCEDRAIEPSKDEHRRHKEAAIAAVTEVHDPQLRLLRNSCLASLKKN